MVWNNRDDNRSIRRKNIYAPPETSVKPSEEFYSQNVIPYLNQNTSTPLKQDKYRSSRNIINLNVPRETSYAEQISANIEGSLLYQESPPRLDINRQYDNILDPTRRPIQAPQETSFFDTALAKRERTQNIPEVTQVPNLNRQNAKINKKTLQSPSQYSQEHTAASNIGVLETVPNFTAQNINNNTSVLSSDSNNISGELQISSEEPAFFNKKQSVSKTRSTRNKNINTSQETKIGQQSLFENIGTGRQENIISESIVTRDFKQTYKTEIPKIDGEQQTLFDSPENIKENTDSQHVTETPRTSEYYDLHPNENPNAPKYNPEALSDEQKQYLADYEKRLDKEFNPTDLQKAEKKYAAAKKDKGQVQWEKPENVKSDWQGDTTEERKRLLKEWKQRQRREKPFLSQIEGAMGVKRTLDAWASGPLTSVGSVAMQDLTGQSIDNLNFTASHGLALPPKAAERIANETEEKLSKSAFKFGGGKYAALGVGAAVAMGGLVTALSSSRGQQSNAQLYGQQPLQY